ncbi:hypothetical protein C8F01DRAFT_1343014 [Mycena amicta]|nr:hypothetical protein C8F01DRAFT_1343014 [Mycena amicta]
MAMILDDIGPVWLDVDVRESLVVNADSAALPNSEKSRRTIFFSEQPRAQSCSSSESLSRTVKSVSGVEREEGVYRMQRATGHSAGQDAALTRIHRRLAWRDCKRLSQTRRANMNEHTPQNQEDRAMVASLLSFLLQSHHGDCRRIFRAARGVGGFEAQLSGPGVDTEATRPHSHLRASAKRANGHERLLKAKNTARTSKRLVPIPTRRLLSAEESLGIRRVVGETGQNTDGLPGHRFPRSPVVDVLAPRRWDSHDNIDRLKWREDGGRGYWESLLDVFKGGSVLAKRLELEALDSKVCFKGLAEYTSFHTASSAIETPFEVNFIVRTKLYQKSSLIRQNKKSLYVKLDMAKILTHIKRQYGRDKKSPSRWTVCGHDLREIKALVIDCKTSQIKQADLVLNFCQIKLGIRTRIKPRINFKGPLNFIRGMIHVFSSNLIWPKKVTKHHKHNAGCFLPPPRHRLSSLHFAVRDVRYPTPHTHRPLPCPRPPLPRQLPCQQSTSSRSTLKCQQRRKHALYLPFCKCSPQPNPQLHPLPLVPISAPALHRQARQRSINESTHKAQAADEFTHLLQPQGNDLFLLLLGGSPQSPNIHGIQVWMDCEGWSSGGAACGWMIQDVPQLPHPIPIAIISTPHPSVVAVAAVSAAPVVSVALDLTPASRWGALATRAR